MRTVALLVLLQLGLGAPKVDLVESAPLDSRPGPGSRPDAIGAFEELFGRAKSTIDIAEFYMLYYPPESRGWMLCRLYDRLIEAAGRGVRIRILVDSTVLEANPSQTYSRIPALLGELPNVEVRRCDLRRFSEYSGCMMHAKYFVIDRRISVIGSHNWSYGAFAENRELSFAIEDKAMAEQVLRVFDIDWAAARGDTATLRPVKPGTGPLTLAVSGPSRLQNPVSMSLIDALASILGGADSTLDIEVNSFTTRKDFGTAGRFLFVDSALRAAAGRGVKARLLVDRWANDQEPELFLELDSIPGIDVKVIDIAGLGPDPNAGTAHAKLVIADRSRFLVGTATFSQRQLLECRNLAVLGENRDLARKLAATFEKDWLSPFGTPP